MTASAVRRDWTEAERLMARALARCSFSVGTFAKRFARDIAEQERTGQGITDRQAECLRRHVAIYRRQIKASSLAPESRELLKDETAKRLREEARQERATARAARQARAAPPPPAPAAAPATPSPQLEFLEVKP